MRRFRGAGTRPRLDTGRLGHLRGPHCAAPVESPSWSPSGRSVRTDALVACSSGRASSSRCTREAPVAVGLDGEALVLDAAAALRLVAGRAARPRAAACAVALSPAGAAVTLTRRNLRNAGADRSRKAGRNYRGRTPTSRWRPLRSRKRPARQSGASRSSSCSRGHWTPLPTRARSAWRSRASPASARRVCWPS